MKLVKWRFYIPQNLEEGPFGVRQTKTWTSLQLNIQPNASQEGPLYYNLNLEVFIAVHTVLMQNNITKVKGRVLK